MPDMNIIKGRSMYSCERLLMYRSPFKLVSTYGGHKMISFISNVISSLR